MSGGTAVADRKETKFATLGERIFVAISSYRHGRRSMDYELKEFREQGDCFKPVWEELFEETGQCLFGTMYYFMEWNCEERAAELLQLLKEWRRHPETSKEKVFPFDGTKTPVKPN
jgi:hypothetical protein